MKIVHKNDYIAEIKADDITICTLFTGKIGGGNTRVLFRGYRMILDLETGGVWTDEKSTRLTVTEFRVAKATLVLE
jgi:hypothetical protein